MPRILCLHGFRMNRRLMERALEPMMAALAACSTEEGWEWIVPNAPLPTTTTTTSGNGVPSYFLKNFPEESKMGAFEWFNAEMENGEMKYRGLETSLRFLTNEYFEVAAATESSSSNRKKIDFVLGFSQGGTLLTIFNSLVENNLIKIRSDLKYEAMFVFHSPFPRDADFLRAMATHNFRVRYTRAHYFFGSRDTLTNRDGEVERATRAKLETPRMWILDENHNLPREPSSLATMKEVMREEIALLRAPTRDWIVAFDFDGVLCDSASETGISAWAACAHDIIPASDGSNAPPPELIKDFARVRPLLETGYEAIVLLYRLAVLREKAEEMVAVTDEENARRTAEILKNDPILSRYPIPELKRRFQEARDAWIARDEVGWFRANGFYPSTVELLKELRREEEENKRNDEVVTGPPHRVYVITTKLADFVHRLLGRDRLPEERVFGLGCGLTKKETIVKLLGETFPSSPTRRSDASGVARCIFIEDRVETLREVMRFPAVGGGVIPIFASYGYSTEHHKRIAREEGFLVAETDADLRRMVRDILSSSSSR